MKPSSLLRIGSFLLLFLSTQVYAVTFSEAKKAYFSGKSDLALTMDRQLWAQERNVDAAVDAALILSELGKYPESLQILEEAYRLFPSSFSLKEELVGAYINQEKYASAKILMESGWDSYPHDISSILLNARFAMGRGDQSTAIKGLNILIDRYPKFTLGYFMLAAVATLEGRSDDAISFYQRILREDSNFIEVRPLLAQLFKEKKQFNDAWKQYARLYYVDGKNKIAKEGMRRLESLITKKPEDIMGTTRSLSFTVIPAVPPSSSSRIIKVGIGTNSSGKPSVKKSISFKTLKPFSIIDPDTNKKLRSGDPLVSWTIRLNSRKHCAEIIDSSGNVRGLFRQAILIHQETTEPSTTILNSLSQSTYQMWEGLSDREVRGDIKILVNQRRKTLVVVNQLTLEEYLYGVLAAEMPESSPIEALKSQVVIARGQALYRRGLHSRYGYDLCDSEHCQVYSGVTVESEKVRKAVDETSGQYLSYQGGLAHTVFSSNCGGVTQSGIQAGWGNVNYWTSEYDGKDSANRPNSLLDLRNWLQEIPEAYCASSTITWHSHYRWTKVIQVSDLTAKLSRKRNIGKLIKVQILQRNGSGRVEKIRFQGSKATITLSKENEIRFFLGLESLRSTLFVMDPVFKEGTLQSFILFGGGWGHGVGLCQSGAAGRATQGQTYSEILQAYFPGTKLLSINK